MAEGLAYVGRIISLEPIPNADFIACATVICGRGGKWKGVVRKKDFKVGADCIVYLPDAQLVPPEEKFRTLELLNRYAFMKDTNFRVKMRRFKGAPSEVLIMPMDEWNVRGYDVGTDVTELLGVQRYIKPVPAHLNGMALGLFPDFIPKTDEQNYQRVEDLLMQLEGYPYYVTEKMDGSSTTAYKHKGVLGVCSRNLELKRDEANGYWKIALKYDLENMLPEGYAVQFETCGPGVQGNPIGLGQLDGFVFNAYNIAEHRNLEAYELIEFCKMIGMPMVKIEIWHQSFDGREIAQAGEGKYANGKPREGVVVRSQANLLGHKPISFKVINLDYGNN